jgi:thiamine biosynthesis lipoprotein
MAEALMKSFTRILILCSAVLIATGCESKPYESTEQIMGTIVTQSVYGDRAKEAAQEASKRIKELESILSFHLQTGDLATLNANAGKGAVRLRPETIFLLKKSLQYSDLTGGSFNILVGPLVKRWNVTAPDAEVPSDAEIKRLLPLIHYKDLVVDEKKGTARLLKKGQMADLGGIAKGYASDEVLAIYRKLGIKKAIIDIGGNIGLLGTSPDGTPWLIGVQSPGKERGEYACVLSLTDCSLSTSGAYERFFEKNGKIYHHIIDPSTGYPADAGLLSASIIAPLSVDSDALSKIFVMGADRGIALIKKIPGTGAVLITRDKRIIVTENLRGKFKLSDKKYTVEFR